MAFYICPNIYGMLLDTAKVFLFHITSSMT
uniref:Uncharacterized protein n=1 Tax=Anguilla anguilla TaxID=7936 RepID=A0A0E9V4H0_ANGAN